MNNMDRSAKAVALFEEGYNCCQAVVLAFSDLLPVDRDVLAALSSSFGGGIGRLREVCGAVSGMAAVAGILKGYSGPETGPLKAEHYARIQKLAGEFEEKHQTIICRELLALTEKHDSPVPEQRTPAYYQKRPCAAFVSDAAGILERFLSGEET